MTGHSHLRASSSAPSHTRASALIPARHWLLVGAAGMVLGCQPSPPPAPASKVSPEVDEAAPPIAFHGLTLIEAPSEELPATRWIRCLPSTLESPETKVTLCEDHPLGWLDPMRDILELDILAHHAELARSGQAHARFVGSKARLSIPLRPVFDVLRADALEKGVATLRLDLELTHDTQPLKGQLVLETIRAGAYLATEAKASPGAEGVLKVGPNLGANSPRPVSSFAWALVETSRPQAPAFCPDDIRSGLAQEAPLRLSAQLVSRLDGRILGTIAEPLTQCKQPSWTSAELEHALLPFLTQHGPFPHAEASPFEALAHAAPSVATLNVSSQAFGLSFGWSSEALIEQGFKVTPFGLSRGSLIAFVSAEHGLEEVRLARPLKEDPLGALVGQPPSNAISALGRPTLLGTESLGWIQTFGHWRYYLELACDLKTCHSLRVGRTLGHDEHADGDVNPSPHAHSH